MYDFCDTLSIDEKYFMKGIDIPHSHFSDFYDESDEYDCKSPFMCECQECKESRAVI